MPDIKVVIIGFSLLIIALDRIVPKDNPSYKASIDYKTIMGMKPYIEICI